MLLSWLKALPDELVQSRPVLSVHYAVTSRQSGELVGVEERLRDAERWLETTAVSISYPNVPSLPNVSSKGANGISVYVTDDEHSRRLPGACMRKPVYAPICVSVYLSALRCSRHV